MIPQIIIDSIGYLFSLSPAEAMRVLWFFIIIDFPRYIGTDIYILFYELIQRKFSKKNLDFIRKLTSNPPLVSIIIPALNEEATIGWTIRSLQEQTYKNLELIIVDDGSTDKTPEICRRLSKQDNILYLRFSERAGKSAVLNYGLKFSSGEFVIFVDSDTTFDRDAIYKLMTYFQDPAVGGISGNLRPRNNKENLLTRLQEVEYIFAISIGRRIRASLNVLPIISGAFGGFRRELITLENIGGHEPGPGNDSDLAIRIRKKGFKIKFQGEAYCLTNVPIKIRKLIKQRSRWDRNMIKNRVRKHKNVYNPFSKNFRCLDLITFIDSLFFHVGLSFITAFYLFDVCWNYPEGLIPLLFIHIFLYFFAEVLELLVSVILSKNYRDLRLIVYLPIFHPFKIFLKFVRMKAYCQELFLRYSRKDPFAPYKVRQQLIKW